MKKITALIIAIVAIFLLDFALSKSTIAVNENSYLMGYRNFHKPAVATKGQKRIILLGGSSLAWGVSAERLTADLGVLTLNAGNHAAVGYRGFYLNAKDVLDKDNDIIVISPEYSIPSDDSYWDRSNEYCEIALYVLGKYPLKCAGYSLAKLAKIIPVLDRSAGDYFLSGFNDFGDYVFRQDDVDLVGKVTENSVCSGIVIDDLLNQYIPFYKNLESQGYNIAYIPNFAPETACTDEQALDTFHGILFKEFGIEGFSESEQLYNEKYFYDADYHLTHEGVSLKTEIFKRHLQALLMR